MARLALPHLDAVTGALSEILQLVARPVPNSLAELGAYAGVSMPEFLPGSRSRPRGAREAALGAARSGQRGPRLRVPARAAGAALPPALPERLRRQPHRLRAPDPPDGLVAAP